MKPFNTFLNGVYYGISYFSIIPIKKTPISQEDIFYKGVIFSLPLVGLFLSILIVSLSIILLLPTLYKITLIAILYLFSYGFVHIYGVLNTLDACYISSKESDSETIYDFMNSYSVGGFGSIGSFCFILIKLLALIFLLYYECYLTIIISLILSRLAIFFALDLEYHKKSYFIRNIQRAFKTSLVAKLLFLPFNIFTKFLLYRLQKKIGFLNHDSLGFTIELQEIVYLNIGILLFILSKS